MINQQAQPIQREQSFAKALVAVGANLPAGDLSPAASVANAMDQLAELSAAPAKKSRLFRTPAFPVGSGPDFINAAIEVVWADTAESLLAALHRIERGFGRTRKDRWEARIMDLDLIALGDLVRPSADVQARWAGLSPEAAATQAPDELILPHPRLAERSFVLVPLADVAPDWVHPITGETVSDMLARRPDDERSEIVALEGADITAEPG